jgi:hypothetical protein
VLITTIGTQQAGSQAKMLKRFVAILNKHVIKLESELGIPSDESVAVNLDIFDDLLCVVLVPVFTECDEETESDNNIIHRCVTAVVHLF